MKLFRALVAFLFLFAIRTPAQFLGYVANQGTNQQVFNNADCSVTLTSPSLINLGQVGHALSYSITSGGLNVQPIIQGSADGVTYFQISNNAPSQPGIISGVGAYAFLRIQVTGGGVGCRITANYTGSTVATTVNLTGQNAQFMYQFTPLTGVPAGVSVNSSNITPPYGNAAGYVVVSYLGGAGPGGSTIAVKAIDGPTGTTNTVATFNLATTAATTQVFPVQGYSASTLFLAYTAGGANANTFTASYYFTYPGQGPSVASSATNVNVVNTPSVNATIVGPNPLPVSGTFTQSSTDPCQSSAVAKSSVGISVTTATTVQLVALSGGKVIYPCAVAVQQNSNTGNITYQFEYGTGASCGTGTTTLTGQMATDNNQISTLAVGGLTLWSIPVSNALCIVTTGAPGANAGAQGFLTYVQQ